MTLGCPIPPGQRHKLQGVRLAGPEPLPPQAQTVQRKVSSRGSIQVARQRIQVGMTHAARTVTIQLGDTILRIIDQHGELITTVPASVTARSADSRPAAPGSHVTSSDSIRPAARRPDLRPRRPIVLASDRAG